MRRPGTPVGAQAGVADPTRGTYVALGFPLVAALLCLGWIAHDPGRPAVPLVLVAALLVAPAVAESVAVQVGPRSWYTACTPAVVLAGLVGGPLLGLAAGASSQVARTDAVWRRRAAEGGIAAIQGFVAGAIGLAAWTTESDATLVVVVASAATVLVNTAGRALIMVERRARPFASAWLRGIGIDLVEAAVAAPLLAVLLVTVPDGPGLVVAVLASVLAVLLVTSRMRRNADRALAAEQANARRDQLTGAPNRRSFEESLAAEHSRIVRGGQPAGLFVVDIDHFKAVNDRYGHAVGDDVIIGVVERLTAGLRAADVVARWGGEEMTVLAPGIRTHRGLEQFGERIRELVAAEPFETAATVVRVTVSVGGTLLDGAASPTSALRRADVALYEAKRTRDASIVALPPRLTLRLDAAAG